MIKWMVSISFNNNNIIICQFLKPSVKLSVSNKPVAHIVVILTNVLIIMNDPNDV